MFGRKAGSLRILMFKKLTELQEAGIPLVLVTVTGAKGSTPRAVGTKMLITKENFYGTIGGGNLEWIAIEKAREILKTNAGSEKLLIPLSSKAQQCCGGSMELFFDLLKPQPQLLIFGAGHVTQALLEVLSGTEFDCTVIDQREEWITAAQQKAKVLPDLRLTTIQENPLTWISQWPRWNSEQTYIVVMTHDHLLDEQIIEMVLKKPAVYVGLIGSETKKQRFIQRFLQNEMDPKFLAKLHCPVGLPIGGDKSPKAVAISIGAELVQLCYERNQNENKLSSALSGAVLEDGPR